ncbi:PQQ-binding-like beta-propeller repeat protein [Cellulomonas sp. URHD0024]|uniref:outer membrane protein assembly factor BamB family protein n=1 Tax=Cellulomonas sp. URHD0024 TaxID=1302620 RepID=UPI0004194F70|nr:PQQ-binding-like beta-propeller repeat protein [Cellulomonas sp. URHD0024]
MGHRSHLQTVELLDAPAVVPVDEAPRLRLSWWGFGVVALVAVAALVGTQAVLDARERAAVARFAAVPGVVEPVGPDVRVRWRPPVALANVVRKGIVADGAFVGLSVADDGSQSVVALEERTGDMRWATSIFGPNPARAASLDRRVNPCEPAGAHQVACLVNDGFRHFDEALRPAVVPPRTTRVVVLDTRDGRTAADRPAPGVTSMAVVPGLAVLSAPGSVTAQDLLTGVERWRYRPMRAGVDLSEAAFLSAVQVFGAGDLVGVSNPGWSVALLDAAGHVVRTPRPAVEGYRYDEVSGVLALLRTTKGGEVRSTILRAGRRDVDVPGTYLDVTVDDGSVPELVLTSDTSVRAWDARTGVHRWISDEVASGSALVVRGRIYFPTMAGIVALDGRTGALLWRSAVTAGHVPGALATDGHGVLVADEPVAGPDRSVLLALGLDDGLPVWSEPLPDGIHSTAGAGRVLLGLRPDGVAVLG